MYSCTCPADVSSPGCDATKREQAPKGRQSHVRSQRPGSFAPLGLPFLFIQLTQGSTQPDGHEHEYMSCPSGRVSALGYDAFAPLGLNLNVTMSLSSIAGAAKPHEDSGRQVSPRLTYRARVRTIRPHVVRTSGEAPR